MDDTFIEFLENIVSYISLMGYEMTFKDFGHIASLPISYLMHRNISSVLKLLLRFPDKYMYETFLHSLSTNPSPELLSAFIHTKWIRSWSVIAVWSRSTRRWRELSVYGGFDLSAIMKEKGMVWHACVHVCVCVFQLTDWYDVSAALPQQVSEWEAKLKMCRADTSVSLSPSAAVCWSFHQAYVQRWP